MNLADPFKQLVERRLWPVALLLVAALVAIPFVLVKKDEGRDVLPAATAALPAGGEDPSQTLVGASDAEKRDSVRSVLGDRKDPFRPAQVRRVPKPETADTTASLGTQAPTGASGGPDVSSGGGSDVSSGGGTTAPTTPTGPVPTRTPEAQKPSYELYSLIVRVGDPDAGLKTRNLKRLSGLPGGTSPALLYLGLRDDHKTAVFIVDAGATVLGDGTCQPAPDNCQTLELRPGETEFVTRGGKLYEVDLVKIITKKTSSPKAVQAAHKSVARGGRKALRARIARVGTYHYSERTGTLRKLSRKAQSARVAKASASGANGAFSSSG